MIDQEDHEQMAYNLHVLPHVRDHYDMDEKYYHWSYYFDSLVLKNCGIEDLEQERPRTILP